MEGVSFLSLIPHLKSLSLNLITRANSISQGAHSGTRKGHEDQLLQHRLYVPGDDLRFLDWRLWARTDKYYVREGIQQSKQRIFLWLDTSMSQRFDPERFECAWLTALCLAWLYRAQHDEILFHDEVNSVPVRGPREFVKLDEFFRTGENDFPEKSDTASTLRSASGFLKARSRLIWVTDLYVPMGEFEAVLAECSSRGWSLAVLHLVQEKEYRGVETKRRGFFGRLIDSETGDWIAANRTRDYRQVWEEATAKRIRMLLARGHDYYRGHTADGPIRILGALGKI